MKNSIRFFAVILFALFILTNCGGAISNEPESTEKSKNCTGGEEVVVEGKQAPPVSVDEVVQKYDEPVLEEEAEGWSEKFKSKFISSCTGGIKSSDFPISDSDIRKICECEIEKIRKEYPNPNVQFDAQIIMKLEEKCGREVLGL
jgi:hypothetical protein